MSSAVIPPAGQPSSGGTTPRTPRGVSDDSASRGTPPDPRAMVPDTQSEPLYGGKKHGRVTVRDIAAAKARGEKWPMLTSYDALTAGIFDEAGIPGLSSATRRETWSSATTRRSR